MNSVKVSLTREIDGVPFGTDRESVRQHFGASFREFKKSKFSKSTTDDYKSFHVFYSADNRFEAIEFFDIPDIEINGSPLPRDYPSICTWVQDVDPAAELESDGITSHVLSIGVYAPDGKVESVLFGAKGYYS